MGEGALVLELITCFVVALALLHHYGDLKRQNVASTIATFVAWYFSFLIVFSLPIDIASTFYRQCLNQSLPNLTTTHTPSSTFLPQTSASPSNVTPTLTSQSLATTSVPPTYHSNHSGISSNHSNSYDRDNQPSHSSRQSRDSQRSYDLISYRSEDDFIPEKNTSALPTVCYEPWAYVADDSLQVLWRFIYWSSQILTWIILPLMQSYANAGEFSIAGKLKTALIHNAIYYGSYMFIFGVLLIYVATNFDLTGQKFKVICITASNTWGLFLLVLLLGYGLVEIPRSLWNSCSLNVALAKTLFKIARLSSEKSEAEEEMEDCLEDIQRASETIRYNHPNRQYIEIILAKCPDSMKGSIRSCTLDDYQDYDENNDASGRGIATETPTEKSLVRLHGRVIRAIQTYHRTQAQWEMVIDRALGLEDEVRNITSNHRTFISVQPHSMPSASFGIDTEVVLTWICSPTVEWYWRCLVRPNLLRSISVALVVLSIMVVWSEVTFFNRSPVLSLFAVIVHSSATGTNYGTAVFLCGATISYLCLCAYYTIFRIRIFNYFYIASDHLTDENSLLFIGTLLCRLTPPLCLNFLGLIHLDSHVAKKDDNTLDTSYSTIMGHLDVIPFIASGFNIYFPILILALCLATYFHLGSRCLHFAGFQQFIEGDDEMTQDFIDDGRNLLHREKRHRERIRAGGSNRRPYRYGTYRQADRTERDGVELNSGTSGSYSSRSSARSGLSTNSDALKSSEQRWYGAGGERDPFHQTNGPLCSDMDGDDDLIGSFSPDFQPTGPSASGYQSGLPQGTTRQNWKTSLGSENIRTIFDDL